MSTTGLPTRAIRRVSASDLPQLRSHMTRLGCDGLRARFGYHLSDRFLDGYVESCASANTILYGYFEDRTMRGVGEMHLAADGPERVTTGELAFSVEPRWRRSGIGTRLVQPLLRAARGRNVEQLMLQFSSNNIAMLSLARRFATNLTFEQGIVTGHVPIHPSGATSRVCEFTDEWFVHMRTTILAASDENRPTMPGRLCDVLRPIASGV